MKPRKPAKPKPCRKVKPKQPRNELVVDGDCWTVAKLKPKRK